MTDKQRSIETKLIHAGEPRPRIQGAVVMPIFQSSTYEYDGEPNYHDVRYIRLNNNPNQLVLNEKLAALEGTENALVTSSGMAAISATLLTVLSAGDHLLALDCLYGGTHGLVTKDLPRYDISHSFIDGDDPDSWEQWLTPKTKAVYIETLTNPLLQVADIQAVAKFAKKHGLVSIIDNTFASPVNFRPAEWGIDVVIESCTKFLNGHSDLVAGAVAGKRDMIRLIKERLDHLGGSLDPHACFLLHRGLKTLAVRLRYQNESALRIARFLSQHPAVERVNYPGLKSHPQHARAQELFDGFGGMISFELNGGAEAADRFLDSSELAAVAVSMGGPETLMVRPAQAVHSNLSPEERARSGISETLIRLSVGLEATEDLIADFEQALSMVPSATA
ncbi:MAG: aminotransferase class I/II-fold pyridoxal phosphate-dependent enzyme [Planctomycetes bacterium]|nr:aminotransferase class I/II-fold pyridoxal phosphate-dependent enzyme [Planctomycetota bacterium]